MEKAGLTVKLLGMWASSYCHRVQLALKLKGVDFQHVEEDLTNKSSLLLQSNPVYNKVPVLLHHDKPIAESLVILEYIDDTWKDHRQLLPENAYERAILRFWCRFSDDKLGPAVGAVFRSAGEEQKAAVETVFQSLKLLEDELREGFFKGRRFFGGDEIGILDIVLGSGSYWLCALEEVAGVKLVDPQTFPRFHAWLCDFEQLPEVKEAIPAADKLLEYAKGLRQMLLSLGDPQK